MIERTAHHVRQQRLRLSCWALAHQIGKVDLGRKDRALKMLETAVFSREPRPWTLVRTTLRVEERVARDSRLRGSASETASDDRRIQSARQSVQQARVAGRQRLRARADGGAHGGGRMHWIFDHASPLQKREGIPVEAP